MGTPERDALGLAYRETQRYLTITGLSISLLLVFVSLGLRNPTLTEEQSFEDAEGFTVPRLHHRSDGTEEQNGEGVDVKMPRNVKVQPGV